MRKIKSLILIGLLTGCVPSGNINNPGVENKPSAIPSSPVIKPSVNPGSSVPSASVIPSANGNASTQNSGNGSSATEPTPSPSPEEHGSSEPVPTSTPVSSPSASASPSGNEPRVITPTPTPKPSVPYAINNPVPEDLTEGLVELIFRDEYKVRYDREAKVFISLTGADLTSINNILKSYNIVEINGFFNFTEERADEYEKNVEQSEGYDVVNFLSSYTLSVKGTNLKGLIEKFRQEPLVRQSNYVPSNHPD